MLEELQKRIKSYKHILLPGLFKICLFTCFTFIFSLFDLEDVRNLIKRNQLINFNVNHNVLVFVHIQKTNGAEFDLYLTQNLVYQDSEKTCRINNETKETWVNSDVKRVEIIKIFKCTDSDKETSKWYWGRQTVNRPCGYYPHLTMLKSCVSKIYPRIEQDNFYFVTVLRDPIKRYLNEWKDAERGETWIGDSQKHQCIYQHYQKCFEGKKNWIDSDLKDFVDCEYNLANNRQTRVLSNSSYDCEDKTDEEMLEEAKQNLQSIKFFGLAEYPNFTQRLFARMFSKNLRLTGDFVQIKSSDASLNDEDLSEQQKKKIMKKIKRLNSLDLELYDFAKDLFFKRLRQYKIL